MSSDEMLFVLGLLALVGLLYLASRSGSQKQTLAPTLHWQGDANGRPFLFTLDDDLTAEQLLTAAGCRWASKIRLGAYFPKKEKGGKSAFEGVFAHFDPDDHVSVDQVREIAKKHKWWVGGVEELLALRASHPELPLKDFDIVALGSSVEITVDWWEVPAMGISRENGEAIIVSVPGFANWPGKTRFLLVRETETDPVAV